MRLSKYTTIVEVSVVLFLYIYVYLVSMSAREREICYYMATCICAAVAQLVTTVHTGPVHVDGTRLLQLPPPFWEKCTIPFYGLELIE